MSLTDGEYWSQARARRLQESIPTSYTVWKDGTSYRAESNKSGLPCYSDTDLATVAQDALDSEEGGVDVYLKLKGNHTVSTTLNLTDGNKSLHGIWHGSTAARCTRLVAGFNSTDGIIKVTDGLDYYRVEDLTLSASTYATPCFVSTAGALHLELKNLQAYGTVGTTTYGFNIVGGQVHKMYNLYAEACQKGIYLASLAYRNTIEDLCATYCQTNIHLNACDQLEILSAKTYRSTMYSGFFIENCTNTRFYGLKSELNYEHGVYMYGSRHCSIIGGTIHNNNQENGVYDGLYLSADGVGTHSTRNNFSHLRIYSDVANVHKYSVEEADVNQDYNLYFGNSTSGAGTAEFDLHGVNSVSLQNR
jgi:hypothetical protein